MLLYTKKGFMRESKQSECGLEARNSILFRYSNNCIGLQQITTQLILAALKCALRKD